MTAKYKPGDDIFIKAKIVAYDEKDDTYELEFPDRCDGYFDNNLEGFSLLVGSHIPVPKKGDPHNATEA